MIRYKRAGGFTIIEMMLSMAFVGALLVAIATTSLHIMRTYTRGVTIREVNQSGRTITEDIQRTIASTMPFSVVPKTGASDDPIDSRYVEKAGQGGRLCTGSYTYAWNYGSTRQLGGESDDPEHPAKPVYNIYTTPNNGVIRFAKVRDVGGMLCVNANDQRIDINQTKELLPPGDRDLAVQSLTVSIAPQGRDSVSGQALYYISLVIGTNDDAQLNASHTACLPPSLGEGGEHFCAINQFNIIARAGNRSGSLQ